MPREKVEIATFSLISLKIFDNYFKNNLIISFGLVVLQSVGPS